MKVMDSFSEEDAQKTPEEIFEGVNSDDFINIKNAPYDDKIRFIRYCMKYTDLVNGQVLTNISFLVFGRNISDEVFKDDKILFDSLEEYVDAKYELKSEIEAYGKDLLRFYLGSIKSYSAILPDGKIGIPSSYKVLLMSIDMYDISRLMQKYPVDFSEVPLVFDADTIVNSFTLGDSPVVKDFIKFVMDGLKE